MPLKSEVDSVSSGKREVGRSSIARRTYLIVSCIFLFGILSSVYVYLNASSDAGLINQSGRQRMLIQRAAKEALLAASGVTQSRAALEKTITEFESVSRRIRAEERRRNGEDAIDQAIARGLEQVSLVWKRYADQLRAAASGAYAGDDGELRDLSLQSERALVAMNAVVQRMQERAAAKTRIKAMESIGLIALILVMVGILAIMVRSVVRRIGSIERFLERMAETRNLTDRYPVPSSGGDELTRMVRSFNTLTEVFRETVRGAIHASAQVGTETARVASAAEQTASGVDSQHDELGRISCAVTEMVASFREVADHAERASGFSRSVHDQANEGRRTMGRAIRSIELLSDEIGGASRVVARLESDSQAIGGVLEVITNVAEKTNLLALNAAIEAARAGEHGRGFAVVADEVRTLANQTRDSADEIQSMVDRLQADAKKAVAAIQSGQERATKGTGEVAAAGEDLDRIIDNIQKVSDIGIEISTATAEQRRAAEEIEQSIASVASVAEQSTHAARETIDAAANIGASIDALRQAAERFSIADDYLDLEKAKSAHLAWRGRLRAYLDGRGGLTREQAVSHRDCVLGQWYYGRGLAQFSSMAAMREIEEPHERLHALIREIVDQRERGNLGEAERLYREVQPLSERIVGLLTRLQDEVREKRR